MGRKEQEKEKQLYTLSPTLKNKEANNGTKVMRDEQNKENSKERTTKKKISHCVGNEAFSHSLGIRSRAQAKI